MITWIPRLFFYTTNFYNNYFRLEDLPSEDIPLSTSPKKIHFCLLNDIHTMHVWNVKNVGNSILEYWTWRLTLEFTKQIFKNLPQISENNSEKMCLGLVTYGIGKWQNFLQYAQKALKIKQYCYILSGNTLIYKCLRGIFTPLKILNFIFCQLFYKSDSLEFSILNLLLKK